MKQPMPLKDLPGYLKDIREHGETGPAPVVGMGQIIVDTPKKSSGSWANKTLAAVMLASCLMLGIVIVDTMTPDRITMIVNAPPASITQVVSDSGGEVVGVKQVGESAYEVQVDTYQNKRSFLDILRRSLNIRSHN